MRAAELRKNDLEKLFQNNPSTPYYAHLADCFFESGDSDELERAIAILEIGIKNFPRDTNGHFILGKCYHKMGDIKNAKSELERTLKYYPNHMGAYKLLLELNEADGLTQVNENLKSYIKIFDPLSPLLNNTNTPIKPIDFSAIDSDVEELEDDSDFIDTSVFDEQLNSSETDIDDDVDMSDFEDVTEPEETIEALSIDEIDDLQNEIGGMIHTKKVKDLSKEDELDALFGDEEEEIVDTEEALPSFEEVVEEKVDLNKVDFFSLSEEELFQDDPEELEKIRERKGIKPPVVSEEKNEAPEVEVADENPLLDIDDSEENLAESVDDIFSMSELDETVEDTAIFTEPEVIEDNSEIESAETLPDTNETSEFAEKITDDVFSMEELSDDVLDDSIFENEIELQAEPEKIIEKPVEKVEVKTNKRKKLSESPKDEGSEEPQILSARVLKPEDVSEDEITLLEDFVTDISEKQASKPVEKAEPIPTSIFQDDLLSDELEMLNNDVATPKETVSEATDDSALLSPTLGEIHMAQGRFSEAKEIFQKLLEKSPNDEKLKRKISDITDILGE